MLDWLKTGIRRWLGVTSATSPVRTKAARGATLTDFMGSGGGIGGTTQPQWSDWDTKRYHTNWVFACVRAVSQRVAGQPLKVGTAAKARAAPKPTKAHGNNPATGGKVRELASHPLLDALADPNPYLTPFALIQLTVASLEIAGVGYWWLDREPDGSTRIWYLPAGWVREDPDAPLPLSRFIVKPEASGEEFPLSSDELIRFALPDPANPMQVLSPLKAVFGSVLTDLEIQTAQLVMFKNGGRPGLLVRIGQTADASGIGDPDDPPALTRAQRKALQIAIKEATSGSLNAGEPVILDAVIREVTRLTNTPAEMDFGESGAITKERIMEGFGVNPIILGHVEGANRASATVADEHFCFSTCAPLCRLMSDTLTKWFRVHYEDPDLVVWIDPPRPRDPDGRRADLDQLIRAGAIRKNELRAEHGLDPLTPEEGGNDLVKAGSAPTSAATTQTGDRADKPGNPGPDGKGLDTATPGRAKTGNGWKNLTPAERMSVFNRSRGGFNGKATK